jgi:hypothetical protein
MKRSPLNLLIALFLASSFALTGCSAQNFFDGPPSLIPTELSEESGETNNSAIEPAQPEPVETQKPLAPITPSLELLISEASYTDLGLEIFLENNPEIVNVQELKSSCTNLNVTSEANVLGCFVNPPGKIFLYGITDARVAGAAVVIAAHEMLHAVWYLELSETERDTFTRLLKKHFDSLPQDHYLRERLALYSQSSDTIPTELHSILGTEAANLSIELEVHYQKYFKNRAAVVALADNSFGYVDRLKKQIKDISANIEAQRSLNETTRNSLESRNTILNTDVNNFNEQVAAGGYSKKSDYDRMKKSLEDRRIELTRLYDVFNAEIVAFNSSIADYNEMVKLSNELNSALNTKSD